MRTSETTQTEISVSSRRIIPKVNSDERQFLISWNCIFGTVHKTAIFEQWNRKIALSCTSGLTLYSFYLEFYLQLSLRVCMCTRHQVK